MEANTSFTGTTTVASEHDLSVLSSHQEELMDTSMAHSTDRCHMIPVVDVALAAVWRRGKIWHAPCQVAEPLC